MSAKRQKTKSDALLIDEFNWDEYLEETNSSAAKLECFFQSEEIPENLFQEDTKVETIDPRSGSSMCIATVVGKLGPRIRLRLDGTDSCNDFWVLVDSSSIHPIGYTHSRGGVLQPPLGFQQDISNWHQYLTKTLGTCVPAEDECFKPEPTYRPKVNLFKVGDKLEVVDKKNPYLMCPATVVSVSREEITVNFDGWSSAFNTKYRYDSRDLFPCGWCQKADFPLQSPPKTKKQSQKLSTQELTVSNRDGSTSPTDRLYIDVDMPVLSPNQLGSKSSGDSIATDVAFQPDGFFSQPSKVDTPVTSNGRNWLLKNGGKSSLSPKTEPEWSERVSLEKVPGSKPFALKTLPQSQLSPLARQKLFAGLNPVVSISATEQTKETSGDKQTSGDLKMLIKNKALRAQQNSSVLTTGKPKSFKADVSNYNNAALNAVTLYVHTNCHPGPNLDPEKLALLPKQFGPGSVNRVFQEATQSLLHCGKRIASLLQFLPSGKGPFHVTADVGTSTGPNFYSLPELVDVTELNTQLVQFLKKMDCCSHLVSTERNCLVCKSSLWCGVKRKATKAKDAIYSLDLSRKRHHSGESSASGPSSTASAGCNNVEGHKTEDPSDWTPENVHSWIAGQKDSTVSCLADLFLKHEIDGKALVLLEGELMIKYMGIRLGPALKVQSLIDRLLGINRRVQH